MPEQSSERPSISANGHRPSPPAKAQLLVQAGRGHRRVTVTVRGEFFLDDSQSLRHALCDALARSAQGVELDLSGLTFADCSALNVLLAVRREAVETGKSVTVTAASPAAERLLTFTDTYDLFSARHDDAGPPVGTPTPPGKPGRRQEDTDDGLLQTELVQLRRALRTRPDIDLARGILMASFGLDADQAWEVLVTASQHTNTKLHRLASDVVTTVRGTSLPEPIRRQLTAAVARTRHANGHPRRPTLTDSARQAVCRTQEHS
ncbi:ANTAR domain-containing protein [Streptomyces camelliae]|uniref:ANTAR domain-containing protein n=1 Tax=Streptomyces camelliae TaxID=3004093 RepID=A0ABY7NUF9_9ACTN|nr:ANTAR domain-containing protein [Streptomyces sp. HUAS 2-6]WBO61850.1 ANTAR domain-containing protein [Streptomyces sp. HUAS 2-6]